ncbi:hypothetical protein [Myxococcus xanthus]|uniref:hypothetical protein n=1 Tax=Myxococcus xanthus TaxID=34 RepID=UPI001F386FBC|nr:hypothetical protein [Myxococcus xanthus]
MAKFRVFVGAAMLVMLSACGPAEEQLSGDGELSSNSIELSSVIPVPDAEMLQALTSSCQPASEGNCIAAGYMACTGWSAQYECAPKTACDLMNTVCRTRVNGQLVTAGTEYQDRNSYRVCSNPQGGTCTEYQFDRALTCGCGGGYPITEV